MIGGPRQTDPPLAEIDVPLRSQAEHPPEFQRSLAVGINTVPLLGERFCLQLWPGLRCRYHANLCCTKKRLQSPRHSCARPRTCQSDQPPGPPSIHLVEPIGADPKVAAVVHPVEPAGADLAKPFAAAVHLVLVLLGDVGIAAGLLIQEYLPSDHVSDVTSLLAADAQLQEHHCVQQVLPPTRHGPRKRGAWRHGRRRGT